MLGNESNKSIWAKIGGVVKSGSMFVGKAIKVTAKGIFIYPFLPKNWFKPWGQLWHDVKNGGRYVIDSSPEEYEPLIKITQSSEDLGVKIKEKGQEKEKVIFVASRTLTGDIPYLNDEQLNKIKTGLPNVTIFREENKVVIEIDIEKIINDIKIDPENTGKNKEEIRKLAIKGIEQEVDRNFKGIAQITGGEFKVHTDRKLLYGIAEKLYQEYNSQKQQSTEDDNKKPSETISSVGTRLSETITTPVAAEPTEIIKL